MLVFVIFNGKITFASYKGLSVTVTAAIDMCSPRVYFEQSHRFCVAFNNGRKYGG